LKLIVDSYAWFEFLLAGPRGPEVKGWLEGPNDLTGPDIVLVEVARRLASDNPAPSEIAGHLRSITALSAVVPIDPQVARESIGASLTLRRHAQRRHLEPPSLAESIILGFARHLDAKVLAAYPHFGGLPETEGLGR
jgi:hypothetical protein